MKEQVSQLNAESYEKSLSSEYRTLLGEYAKYSTSVVYYEKQAIPEAELIIDQATRSYNGGAMDYIDYVLNIDRAISIKQNYLDALNNYNQTIVRIDFITGKLF